MYRFAALDQKIHVALNADRVYFLNIQSFGQRVARDGDGDSPFRFLHFHLFPTSSLTLPMEIW